jgi:uncharacterized protein YyaL (SSP411 family)
LKPDNYTNRLALENSLYLKQHAGNPVNWFPWCQEAFDLALSLDKPILVSIGYSSCHWCHVMEKESFEDPEVAGIMNEEFINIKVDREEHPEVDAIYMDALQTINGQGGWPLNCFLLPNLKPFYGGTYFPPIPKYGRMSWKQVILAISQAYKTRRTELEEQANNLTIHLKGKSFLSPIVEESDSDFHKTYLLLAQNFDITNGGFGQSPKFPGTFSLEFLLNYWFFTRKKEALDHVLLSLDAMAAGGIYDQIEGGFHRYATDSEWKIPHFEKMLYDNALLAPLYCQAFIITGNLVYKLVAEKTIDFIINNLSNPEGGFHASIDADSEGIEGKYYCWQESEIQEILKEDASNFFSRLNVSSPPNWELGNILYFEKDFLSQTYLKEYAELEKSFKKLLLARETRVKPQTDKKIILSWNGLAIKALSNCGQLLNEPKYIELAVKSADFILSSFYIDGKLHRIWQNGEARIRATLEDYALFINSLLFLYQTSWNTEYFTKSELLIGEAEKLFLDNEDGFFYSTSDSDPNIIIRKKEVFDSAIPSPNSVMLENYDILFRLTGNPDFCSKRDLLQKGMKKNSLNYPSAFGNWLKTMVCINNPGLELVSVGEIDRQIDTMFWYPGKVRAHLTGEIGNLEILSGKRFIEKGTSYYICTGGACQLPVNDRKLTLQQINRISNKDK